MGLLERALSYKQKLNETGKETLIDKIKGPADSFVSQNTIQRVNVHEIDENSEEIRLESTSDNNENQITDITDGLTEVENNISDHSYETDIHKEENIILFEEETVKRRPDTDLKTTTFSEKSDETEPAIEDNSIDPDMPDSEVKDRRDDTVIASNTGETEYSSFEMPEFNDYSVLFEIQKEFIEAESVEDVYKTILFAVMGQIGVSSASILGASDDKTKWAILDSNGIEIDKEERTWDPKSGILMLLDSFRGILDIEDLKNDINLRDDYYKFVSVDTRIITPLVYGSDLFGAILVGEKINSDEFTSSDTLFLLSVTDMASQALTRLLQYEEIHVELLGLRIEKEIMWDVEILQDMILATVSTKELAEVLNKNFYSLGIECYTVFLSDLAHGWFYPAYWDKDDLLGFGNSGFKIKKDNKLINFYLNKKSSIIVENFEESGVLAETFGRERLSKFDVFISYPFIISGKLEGFITLFKINAAVDIIDIDIRLQKIIKFLFPYISEITELDPAINIYNDLTEVLYGRIETELSRSLDLHIPLSLILFSIKNFKRFYDRFGRIEMNKLFEKISVIIKSKLYSADFSVRIDRHKFMLILPGKDRKYSTTLSSILKNEISDLYSNSDFKLLVNSAISVYPEDGNDLFALLEVIE